MSPKKISRALDVYVRVSRVGKREGDSFISPEVQEEKCRALAKARGLKVGRVFVDLDRSGGKMDRPAFKEALQRIESGESGGLIVARIDRFARTLIGGLQSIESIEKAGGVVLTADGEFDTSTATGELVLRIMLSMAAFELRRISEQWEDAKARARARGVHIGNAPAGYVRQADGTLAESEHLDAVREAFRLKAAGAGVREVARYLTEAGVPTSKGNSHWSDPATRGLLQNERYREVVGGPRFRKAQPEKGVSHRSDGFALGEGLVRCPCGAGLTRAYTTKKGKRYAFLRCQEQARGGVHASIAYDAALEHVLHAAVTRFESYAYEKVVGGPEREALEARLAEARQALAEVETLAGVSLPPESPLCRAVEEAEDALAALGGDEPRVVTAVVDPVLLLKEGEFEKLSPAEQRRTLRELGVERVVLSPGRGPVSERLRIEFKDGGPVVEPEYAGTGDLD